MNRTLTLNQISIHNKLLRLKWLALFPRSKNHLQKPKKLINVKSCYAQNPKRNSGHIFYSNFITINAFKNHPRRNPNRDCNSQIKNCSSLNTLIHPIIFHYFPSVKQKIRKITFEVLILSVLNCIHNIISALRHPSQLILFEYTLGACKYY